jgi:hypothetical protein
MAEPPVVHQLGEAADAVPTHLGNLAVGVVVVHEEIGSRESIQAAVSPNHSDQSVCSDAEPSVAQGSD